MDELTKPDIEENDFENTLAALRKCQERLDALGNSGLDESEYRASCNLVRLCKQIADDYSTSIW